MVDTATRRAPKVPATEWLTALPPAMRFAFYGDAAARTAVLPAWGVEFSEDACRARRQAARATLWLGPDEYLLLDLEPGEPEVATLNVLERTLQDIPHALVDVSHRQLALQVSGRHAATILSGACPLDLDLGEFPVGMCTRTVLAKADVVLWRTQEHAFHLEIWRSFTGYVTGVLGEIAAEFYPASTRR